MAIFSHPRKDYDAKRWGFFISQSRNWEANGKYGLKKGVKKEGFSLFFFLFLFTFLGAKETGLKIRTSLLKRYRGRVEYSGLWVNGGVGSNTSGIQSADRQNKT